MSENTSATAPATAETAPVQATAPAVQDAPPAVPPADAGQEHEGQTAPHCDSYEVNKARFLQSLRIASEGQVNAGFFAIDAIASRLTADPACKRETLVKLLATEVTEETGRDYGAADINDLMRASAALEYYTGSRPCRCYATGKRKGQAVDPVEYVMPIISNGKGGSRPMPYRMLVTFASTLRRDDGHRIDHYEFDPRTADGLTGQARELACKELWTSMVAKGTPAADVKSALDTILGRVKPAAPAPVTSAEAPAVSATAGPAPAAQTETDAQAAAVQPGGPAVDVSAAAPVAPTGNLIQAAGPSATAGQGTNPLAILEAAISKATAKDAAEMLYMGLLAHSDPAAVLAEIASEAAKDKELPPHVQRAFQRAVVVLSAGPSKKEVKALADATDAAVTDAIRHPAPAAPALNGAAV